MERIEKLINNTIKNTKQKRYIIDKNNKELSNKLRSLEHIENKMPSKKMFRKEKEEQRNNIIESFIMIEEAKDTLNRFVIKSTEDYKKLDYNIKGLQLNLERNINLVMILETKYYLFRKNNVFIA